MADNRKDEKEQRKERLKYKFETAFADGVRSQFFILLVLIILIMLVCGPVSALLTGNELGASIRSVLKHFIDKTAIIGDDPTNALNFLMMLGITILGIAFYSTFLGIVTNAITSKSDELRKGHSRIIEEGHVVILGFSDSIHTILYEMGQSNKNWTGNKKIVIVDETGKEKMEDSVQTEKKELIFRSGDLVEEHTLYIASVEKARTVILNSENDYDLVRVMLALVSYLKKNDAYMNEKMPTIVALTHSPAANAAVKIAAGVHHDFDQDEMTEFEKKIRILYFEEILSHLFAQACRQPGLSWVITEMFDYAGSEFYIEDVQKGGAPLDAVLCGKSLKEINAALVDSVGVGFQRDGEILINPDPDAFKFQKGDKLIHMAKDDNEICLSFNKGDPVIGTAVKATKKADEIFHFLFLGWNEAVPSILDEIRLYAAKGSTVTILSDKPEAGAESSDKVTVVTKVVDPVNFEAVYQYLEAHAELTNIVILTDASLSRAKADELTTILLLNVREYLKDRGLSEKVNVTTEIKLAKDQKLLSEANHNDFIVGSEIANRMLVQIANDPKLYTVFLELLSDEGSEFYLRSLTEYVDVTKPFNFNFISQQAADRAKSGKDMQEIVLGWIRLGTDTEDTEVHINPTDYEKAAKFSLKNETDSYSNYRVVVVAVD